MECPGRFRAEPEWAVALHLLRSPPLRNKGRLRAVDFDCPSLDFPGLADKAVPWSHWERIRLCAAWVLFNGGDRTTLASLLHEEGLLSEAIAALTAFNLRRLLEAATLQRSDVNEPYSRRIQRTSLGVALYVRGPTEDRRPTIEDGARS